ncbi:MAG: hypothetical protein AB201_01075 [Parcubacteria bacterium C7867-006]|nr:MAG: hypothetical protein AB201_01075 [Parcubacteria bacterium C7867-006]
MKSDKIAIIFILVAVFIIIVVLLSNFTYRARVVVGGAVFNVDVAETKYLLEKGLSGHKPLTKDEGMFFVFQKPDNYGFWMKDMLFPIDIIWISSDFKITHIEKSVLPETYPKVFYPEIDSMYVLEISAGSSDALNLKIGDSVQFFRKTSKNS